MLNPEPLKVSSVASRCWCSTCGNRPASVMASGSDPIKIRVECHGQMEERTVSKKELTFTQTFFKNEEDDGGDYHD